MEAETLDDACSTEHKTLHEVLKVYETDFEKIVMKDISFSYPSPVHTDGLDRGKKEGDGCAGEDGTEKVVALSGWNFEIKKGEYVAITGPSGCGKSTLLKLLMCLYDPDEGSRYLQITDSRITLDGSWQRLFAYVPQGNYLMSGTIREMVTFSDHRQSMHDEEIWRALSIACADEFVRKFEHGIEYGTWGKGRRFVGRADAETGHCEGSFFPLSGYDSG